MKETSKKAQYVAWKSLFSNLFLALIKGITGFLGNSFALLADAIESLTDVFASLSVILGLRYAAKPPDQNHPYGHGKAEPLTTFLISLFLIISATLIAFQSIHNLLGGSQEVPEPFTIYILGGIILFKELSYRYVKAKGQELKSSSLKAEAWHHRSDALSSAVAFMGIAIALIFGEAYAAADEIAALAASLMIYYNAYLIFRPALGEVMDEQQYPALENQIRVLSLDLTEIKGTEKCHIRKFGFGFHVDLHVEIDGKLTVTRGHQIAHHLKDYLRAKLPEVMDVHIHIEPSE